MTRRPRRLTLLALALILAGAPGMAACGADEPARADQPAHAQDPAHAEEVTRRQRDSVIGESRLPGAHGVRGALDASDAAAARAAALDSAAAGH
jgi:hypothetical protein